MRTRRVELVCANCGATFGVQPCYVQRYRFCSPSCRSAAQEGSLAQRFWGKVAKKDDDECWEWLGARTSPPPGARTKGYGHLGRGGRGQGHVKATHVSWEIHFGPVPEGLWLLHTCDNPGCVNPAHLFLGDAIANVADMMAKGRHNPVSFPGESNPSAKLTRAQVDAIRLDERTHAVIAEAYGIGKSTVGNIRRGATWR